MIVKLTPNITNIVPPARAALEGGADAVSLINTINSIMRVDYDNLTMYPTTDGMGTHGGYCGEAVKADRAEHGGGNRAHPKAPQDCRSRG